MKAAEDRLDPLREEAEDLLLAWDSSGAETDDGLTEDRCEAAGFLREPVASSELVVITEVALRKQRIAELGETTRDE